MDREYRRRAERDHEQGCRPHSLHRSRRRQLSQPFCGYSPQCLWRFLAQQSLVLPYNFGPLITSPRAQRFSFFLEPQSLSHAASSEANNPLLNGAHGVVVSHPLRMRKALGSIPSVSILIPAESSTPWLRFAHSYSQPDRRAMLHVCACYSDLITHQCMDGTHLRDHPRAIATGNSKAPPSLTTSHALTLGAARSTIGVKIRRHQSEAAAMRKRHLQDSNLRGETPSA